MSEMQKNTDTVTNYDEESKKILKEFIGELNSANIGSGEYPQSASRDLKYTAELQRKRLNDKNANISYQYTLDTRALHGSAIKLDRDTRYITRMPFYIMDSRTEYSVGGKVKKKDKLLKTMYANVIWLIDQDKDASYCCPNCGAVSSVKKLLSGCPYCKTGFIMSDLFPKITNYYDRKAKETINSTVVPFSLLGILIVLSVYGFFSYDTLTTVFTSDDMTQKIIQGILLLGCAVFGAVSGYILKAVANVVYVC